MLLIDSAYDYSRVFLDLSSHSAPANALPSSGIMSLSGLASTTVNIAEYGGSMKERVKETLFSGERHVSKNVVWAITSSPSHTVLLPTVEFDSRLCQSGKQAGPPACNSSQDCVPSNYPADVFEVCNSSGIGKKLSLSNGFGVTLWSTTESWKRVTVNGQSIQEIISQFVGLANSSFSTSSLMMDLCPGPNCVPKGSTGENLAQSLVEIDNTFRPVSLWLGILVSIFALSIPCFYALIILWQRVIGAEVGVDGVVKTTKETSKAQNIYLNRLNVHSNSGDQILDDVSIRMKSSTLNCLLGKSGSGKSTMLGVLRYVLCYLNFISLLFE